MASRYPKGQAFAEYEDSYYVLSVHPMHELRCERINQPHMCGCRMHLQTRPKEVGIHLTEVGDQVFSCAEMEMVARIWESFIRRENILEAITSFSL